MSELEEQQTFQDELEALINKYSLENYSNTPDFILAEYLAACLGAFNIATKARTKWYEPEGQGESNQHE